MEAVYPSRRRQRHIELEEKLLRGSEAKEQELPNKEMELIETMGDVYGKSFDDDEATLALFLVRGCSFRTVLGDGTRRNSFHLIDD